MTDWQVVSLLLAVGFVAQEWAHRKERRDLLNRLMVDKGHTEYFAEDKPKHPETRGSTIRTDQVKRLRATKGES